MQPGQQRQQINEQLGLLEERLEDLGALALNNERQMLELPPVIQFGSEPLVHDAIETVRELQQLIHEQQLYKSVPAHDFLQRIAGLLIQEAVAQNCAISIGQFGEGKISMEMAELVLGAILTGFRRSVKNLKSETPEQRVKSRLFKVATLYLEVKASSTDIQFRLTDDSPNSQGSDEVDLTGDKQIHKLREHIARCGGWFGHSRFKGHGSLIEFKVPLSHSRLEALVVRQGTFEVLIPGSCVAEIVEKRSAKEMPEDSLVLCLDEEEGLLPGSADAPALLRIGVADLQFWLACDSIGRSVRTRRLSIKDFVEKGCWLQNLGTFREEGSGIRSLPLLEGPSLVQLYRRHGGSL